MFCIGCGQEHDLDVDAELAPLLDRYLELAPNNGKYGELIALKFGNTGSAHGNCNVSRDKVAGMAYGEIKRSITIQRKPSGDYTTTVFHELGHCLHGLGHTDGMFDIMNPNRASNSNPYWDENIDSAVRKMFE